MILGKPLTAAVMSLAFSAAPATAAFKFYGVNEAAANFGTELPGQYGVDYTWPNPDSIKNFTDQGFNTIRIGVQMERLTPDRLTAKFDRDYLGNLTSVVELVTSQGAYALIDPHNYGRFYNDGPLAACFVDILNHIRKTPILQPVAW